MKKLLSLSLCALACISASAQVATVEQAKKLAGKPDKIEEARALIKQALNNPETANQAQTYFVAGKIEWDAYDKNFAKQLTNPDGVNPIDMGNELINGYNYFMQVFPLDELPNEKGEIKPKYTKDLQKKISEKTNNFYDTGINFYNNKQYYPEAYQAFMIYGDMPEQTVLGKNAPIIADTIRAMAYFNAGVSAWAADKLDEAAVAFGKARENNYQHPEAYIYELACWQTIEQRDSTRESEAADKIFTVARSGFDRFGMDQPVFLNNIVNTMVHKNKENDALAVVNEAIAAYPDKAALYGLRGFVNDRMKNEEASEADYRKAMEMPDVDYETLRNGVTKIFRVGQEKWNNIELGDPNTKAKKDDIRKNYFQVAKKYAEKAKSMAENPDDMDYLIESIDYQLSL